MLPEIAPKKPRAPKYRGESSMPPPRAAVQIKTSGDVYDLLKDLHAEKREHFVAFFLDVRHRVLSRKVIAIGSMCGVEVHPRELFRDAIVAGAAAMIVAHNHPSGDVNPSRMDVELTARLFEVGVLIGIPILDHLVFCPEGFYSFQEQGRL